MKITIPITIFPIEEDGYHLKVAVKINGKNATMILDTGASRSVFDENRIVNFLEDTELEEQERLSTGLGTSTMTSKKVVLDQLELDSICIKNYEATILDLQHVNASYLKLDLEEVDGVLGGDILADYNAIIDYGKKELVLSV